MFFSFISIILILCVCHIEKRLLTYLFAYLLVFNNCMFNYSSPILRLKLSICRVIFLNFQNFKTALLCTIYISVNILVFPVFRCFAIDRSGLVIIHKDFISSPPKSQMHITQKERAIADNMVNVRSLLADSCVSYEDITNQLFWKVRGYIMYRS